MELSKDYLTIGLDFGTTNTVVSFYKKSPIIFKDSVKDCIPTKICFENKISCGNYVPIDIDGNSKKIISNFKTKIGTNFEYQVNDKTYKENEILVIFFNHIIDLLNKKFPNTKFNTILTVPSNFNDNQRKIIMSIASKVGFNVLRIINEPTAAAFSYGLTNKLDEDKIMVFDLGGGTLDMTLLEIDENFFETVDSIGVNDLGGNDFTRLIYNDCLREFKLKNSFENNDNILISQTKLIQLLFKCNKAKEKLTWVNSCQISIKDFYKKTKNEKIDLVYNLDFEKFKQLSIPLLDRIKRKLTPFKSKYKLSELILVGGSSKLKIIQDLLEEEFKIKPKVHSNLQHVVSLGACYYGALIQNQLGNDEIILIDNLPLSLGIETAEGNFSVIIPKNTPLPVKRTQKYTIDTPGEEEVYVKVYQGERTIAKKNYLIGEFEFNKISKVGMPIINITFKVDINGIINISIEDKHSGESKDILIRNIDENINVKDILKEAIDNKEEDDKELIKNQLFYKIEIRIENILHNTKENNLISKNNKDKIIEELVNELDNLNTKTIPELIKLDKILDDKYFTLSSNNNSIKTNEEINDSERELNIEGIILKEKIEFLKDKLDFYISKDITEFQRECLNKIYKFLESENINQIDIDEKTEYIKELFKENEKDELKQLCLFLKDELENFNLDITGEQYKILSEIVNKYLNMLENDSKINYKEEINNLNQICENLLKK